MFFKKLVNIVINLMVINDDTRHEQQTIPYQLELVKVT